MEAELVARARAAAMTLATQLRLPVHDVVVIHNSNKLALRLLPCDVLARVAPAPAGREVAALELALAVRLAATGSPVAVPEPRVEPRVHELDGFAVTYWRHYEHAARHGPAFSTTYAGALHRLHAGMRRVELATPHVLDRVGEAERLVGHRPSTPALGDADRQLVLGTLRRARAAIRSRGAHEQLLHGEPHPGNLLDTGDGPRFIDFETCCRGPVEFDVAHVPADVAARYPDVDRLLLASCRQLVLAMVAAWRWDVGDEFPDGRRHGRAIVALLRRGPPWPTLDTLTPSASP